MRFIKQKHIKKGSIMRQNNEKGYTMIETILYIGILGVLGAILASYAGSVITRYKTGRITQQIVDLKKAIINYTAADEDYTSLDMTKMQEDKAVPLDMRDLHHALSGRILFGPVGNGTNEKYLFYITFENIYRQGCVELLSQGQFYGDGSDMDTLIVNNKTAWFYEHSFYDTTSFQTRYEIRSNGSVAIGIRPTMDQIMKACDDEENNSITWIFS